MAAISNTVQGLNETVGLLKQILKAVKGDGKKGADAKDVANTSNILSEIDEEGAKNVGIVVSSLKPLDKMKDDVGDKAKDLADAIKILSSKEVVEGLKRYKGINAKIASNIAGIFIAIGKAFDKIDSGINLGKINKFAKTLSALVKALNEGVKVLYKLAGFVVVCALVGVLATFAWKQILIGFAAILATALGVVAIYFILTLIREMSEEWMDSVVFVLASVMALGLIVAVCALVGWMAQNTWEQILIGYGTILATALGVVFIYFVLTMIKELSEEWMKSAAFMIGATLALGLVVMVCAVVGWLAQNHWEEILIGFATIAAMVLGVVALVWFMGMLMQGLKRVSFRGLKGNLAFSAVNKTLGQINDMLPKSVKDVLMIIVAISILPIACVIVGYIAMNNFPQIVVGFAVIAAILTALIAALFFISKVANTTKTAQKNLKTITITLASLLAMVLGIVMIAKVISDNDIPYTDILVVVGLLAGVMISLNFLIKAISKIKVNKKGTATILGIVGIIALVVLVVGGIAILAKTVDNVGGWGKVFLAVASMAGVITAMMAFAMAIGALTLINIMGVPIVTVLTGAGMSLIFAISAMTLAVSVAVLSIAKCVEECEKAGIKMEDLPNIGVSIGDGLGGYIKGIITGLEEVSVRRVRQIGRMMKPIAKTINTCSLFLKMISSFTTDGCTEEELCPVFYNEKTERFNVAPKINVVNIGTAIAGGFAGFIKGVVEGLEGVKRRRMRQIGKMMDPVSEIITTCSKFLRMISSFTTDGTLINENSDVALIYPVFYNEATGGFEVGEPIDVVTIGKSVAGGFGAFISAIVTELEGIKKRKMKKIGKMMEPVSAVINSCSQFVNMILGLDGDSNAETLCAVTYRETVNEKGETVIECVKGNPVNVGKIGETVALKFGLFVEKILEGLSEIEGKSRRKLKRLNKAGVGTIISACSTFIQMISTISGSSGDVLYYYLTDAEGNYIPDGEGGYAKKEVNVKEAGVTIASAFSSFAKTAVDGLANDNLKKQLKNLDVSPINNILNTISNFIGVASSFTSTNGKLAILMKDSNGNYILNKDGTYKSRTVDLPNIGLLIKNAFNGFIDNVKDVKASSDFGAFAVDFDRVANSFNRITDSIYAKTEDFAKKAKKTTDAINKFTKAVTDLRIAINNLNNVTINDINFGGEGIPVKIVGSGGGGGTGTTISSDTIRDGVIEAMKRVHFEFEFENGEGEILPVKRGSKHGKKNLTNTAMWSRDQNET